MSLPLFSHVVLTREIPEEGLRPGDIGTIVEVHRDSSGNEIGFEVEFFSANGDTLAVASVPLEALRKPSSRDRLTTRVS
jgi:hypothetical protein